MMRSRWTVPRMIAGAVVLVGLGILLGLPFASRAQQPAAPPAPAQPATPVPATPAPATPAPAAPAASAAPAAPGYVGAEVCKGCHEEAFQRFAKTRMGRMFLLLTWPC